MPISGHIRSGRFLAPVFLVLALTLSACATPPRQTGINDPYEASNRKVHAFNKSLDRTILKPASGVYGAATRGPISKGVSNFSANMSLPGVMVNDLLQLNLTEFFGNSFRFAMNTTVGLGGLFDVATQNGLPEYDTDFGETLYVWGLPEGKLLELPVYSARTQRETVGLAVDFVIDPMNFILPGNYRTIGTVSHVLNSLGNRDKFSNIIESVLYGSADSYAQSRLLYLQKRRFKLYGGLNENNLEDPYAN